VRSPGAERPRTYGTSKARLEQEGERRRDAYGRRQPRDDSHARGEHKNRTRAPTGQQVSRRACNRRAKRHLEFCVERDVGRRASFREARGSLSSPRSGHDRAAPRRRRPSAIADDDAGIPAGRPPHNKGHRYPADPPTVEEIVAVMRAARDGRRNGCRLRGPIVGLGRAGVRIHEALALNEPDLDHPRGALLVRRGKGGHRRGRHARVGPGAPAALDRRDRRVIRRLIGAHHPDSDVLDTTALDPPRRPLPDRVAIQQQRDHHRRIVRRPAVPVGPIAGIERAHIQVRERVDHKPRQMALRPTTRARSAATTAPASDRTQGSSGHPDNVIKSARRTERFVQQPPRIAIAGDPRTAPARSKGAVPWVEFPYDNARVVHPTPRAFPPQPERRYDLITEAMTKAVRWRRRSWRNTRRRPPKPAVHSSRDRRRHERRR
jgi:integrase